ncbi:MAG: UTRA domain-containing protein [Firmicutes bacterium]|nr:UTRA domain-containing protein [Bacillota bacterium]
MEQETIKSKVLRVARQDPFLSIEEIANQVETTPRYVRTILSESQVSLMQLRKEYAKRLEQQLQPSHGLPTVTREYEPQLKIDKVVDSEMAKLLDCPAEQELLRVSRLDIINQIPVFVELTTYREVTVSNLKGSLRQLLSIGNQEKTVKPGESWIEVVPNNDSLSKLLTGRENQPLLRVCFLLYNKEVPIAVETQWLSADGVLLRSKTGSIEIEAQVGS